ncbi:UDP-2,3-diacylglucosamine diphosphatase [Halorhodospira neutriphila]|uniref:UDP-2,3-diacylglucosamine hydrolase n=1 Tax=Halorhodospira neutriphila TaxID=168379 RepID=A0ABS1E4L3_9GAMM|nr:UDP-2,3-diacylglucosamine diphosphatase [Halorhodospira neutriphila]MBK1726087.1 UDP-2,3-diacylglucosamine diphosphatase [Halorhodospira neutriphila]
MTQPILLIADLHLDPSRPAVTRTLQHFLEREAPGAAALYILGDLFEAWVGDDAVRGDEPEIAALRSAAEAAPLYIMPGNRDFLLGERFAELTGAQLLPDPSVAEIHGDPALLMHGDSLCTDDEEYMAFRATVRDPAWQAQFLALSVEERLAQARQARSTSAERGQALDEATMDVTGAAVDAAVAEHGARWLIHGHTHCPGVHELDTPFGPGQRYVLGDWFEQGSVLRCLPEEWRLEALPLEAE